MRFPRAKTLCGLQGEKKESLGQVLQAHRLREITGQEEKTLEHEASATVGGHGPSLLELWGKDGD